MHVVELPAHCDRKAAAALYPELLEAVDAGPVRIEAGKVERMGMAMLQLLLAARRSGHELEFAAPSDAFAAAFRLAGQEIFLTDGEPV